MLPGVTPAEPADLGDPDPILAGALASGDIAAALARLLLARLLLPVVAAGEPARDGSGEKSSETSVPLLVDATGGRALPAFTGTAALRRWRRDARPVPMPGARLIAGAVAQRYDAVVVDICGPHPLQLTGPVLQRLAEAAARLLAGEASAVDIVEVAERDAGHC